MKASNILTFGLNVHVKEGFFIPRFVIKDCLPWNHANTNKIVPKTLILFCKKSCWICKTF